jgi:hypothetical protein
MALDLIDLFWCRRNSTLSHPAALLSLVLLNRRRLIRCRSFAVGSLLELHAAHPAAGSDRRDQASTIRTANKSQLGLFRRHKTQW